MSDRGAHIKDKEDLSLPYHEPINSSSSQPVDKKKRREKKIFKFSLHEEINAFLGEFIGTFMFLSLAFSGTQIALNAVGSSQLTASSNKLPDVGKLLYIAFAFGVSLAINVAIFAEVSGGKFNPAVSHILFFSPRDFVRREILPRSSV